MTWVSWRLQRTEIAIAGAILALIAVLLVPTGIEMANAYHHDGLSACLTRTSTDGCNQAVEGFTQRFQGLSSLLGWLTLVTAWPARKVQGRRRFRARFHPAD